MKYMKGSIVEVLTITDTWHCGQIVSGNEHDYTVKYDVYPGFTKVESVSTKFIRPCPPSVEISEFTPGDVVEVFHNLSWKMAIVSKVFSWDLFLVRLVGSFFEFEATRSELRVRQCWKNNKWIVIGKVYENSKDAHYNKLLDSNLQFGAQNENLQESHIVSTRTLKRGSPYFSQDEVNKGTSLKFKITQKKGKRLRVIATSPEKVDADVANDDDDDDGGGGVTCSVGSCSINSYSDYNMKCKSGDFEDSKSYDSDAESVIQGGYQENHSLCNKKLATEIHRLELQAYCCTIEALHASGPLTWEKETMVTNLRMLLHISNDEHLIVLKKLIYNIRNR